MHPLVARLALTVSGLHAAFDRAVLRAPALARLLPPVRDYIGRTARRLEALFARFHAGRPLAPRPRVPRPPRPRRAAPGWRLPRRHAWLPRHMIEANGFASQLQHLFAEPGFADLLAAAPQTGRLLRPLCRLLGLEELPPALRPLPARPRPPRRRPSPPAGAPPAEPLRWGKYRPHELRRYSPGRIRSPLTRPA